jgi:CRISPR-associated protein Csm4
MTTKRVRFSTNTTLGTPLHADTLWGHLVVYYGYRYGQDALGDLLEQFEEDPPFVVSDGFPEGYLPRPRLELNEGDMADLTDLVSQEFDDVDPRMVVAQVMDHFRKSQFIRRSTLEQFKDGLSLKSILSEIIKQGIKPVDDIDPRKLDESIREYQIADKLGYDPDVWRPDIEFKTSEEIKNVVNRMTGSSDKMFGQHELYWDGNLDVYFRIFDDRWHDLLDEVLEDIELTGYGKNKSTGKGHLIVESVDEVELPSADDSNAFVSLSSFVPAEQDPTDGSYGIRVKRGKVGEWFPRDVSPFKRPALMLETGSTFKTDRHDLFYGSLLDDIHFDPDIRHYAYSFPMHVRLTNGGSES